MGRRSAQKIFNFQCPAPTVKRRFSSLISAFSHPSSQNSAPRALMLRPRVPATGARNLKSAQSGVARRGCKRSFGPRAPKSSCTGAKESCNGAKQSLGGAKTLGRPLLPGSKTPFAPSPNLFGHFLRFRAPVAGTVNTFPMDPAVLKTLRVVNHYRDSNSLPR